MELADVIDVLGNENEPAKQEPAATTIRPGVTTSLTPKDVTEVLDYSPGGESTATGTFLESAKANIGAGIGGAAGAAVGVALAPETMGLSLLVPLAAAFVGSAVGGNIQQDVERQFKTPLQIDDEIRKMSSDEQQHAVAAMAGRLTTTLPFWRPSPQELMATARGVGKIAFRGVLDDVEKQAVLNSFLNMGIGSGQSVGHDIITGQSVSLKNLVESGATNFLINKPTFLGRTLGFHGDAVAPTEDRVLGAKDTKSRIEQDTIEQDADALLNKPTDADHELSSVYDAIADIKNQFANPDLDEAGRVQLRDKLSKLDERRVQLEAISAADQPPVTHEQVAENLVNEKKATELAIPEDVKGYTREEYAKWLAKPENIALYGKTPNEVRVANLLSRLPQDRVKPLDFTPEPMSPDEATDVQTHTGNVLKVLQQKAEAAPEPAVTTVTPEPTAKTEVATETPVTTTPEEQLSLTRSRLEEEHAYLSNLSNPEDPQAVSSRLREIKALLADNQKLAVEKTEPVHKFGRAKLPDNVTEQSVEAKRNQFHSTVDDMEGSPEYKGRLKAAFENHLNFLAGEDIQFARSAKTQRVDALGVKRVPGFFSVEADKDGTIRIRVPDEATFRAASAEEAKRNRIPLSADELDAVGTHEVIHAAHLVSLRDKWKAKGSRGDFSNADRKGYADKRISELGRYLEASDKGLAEKLKPLYPVRKGDAYTTGGEFMRMMIERARTGQLTEDVRAQAELARQGGRPYRVLQAFLEGARRIKETIARYLNPDTTAKSIKKVYDEVNRVLDNYGIVKPRPKPPVAELRIPARPLVNENLPIIPEERAPVPTETPKVEPKVPVAPTEQEARVAAHEEKLQQLSERRTGVTEARKDLQRGIQLARQAVRDVHPDRKEVIREAARRHVILHEALHGPISGRLKTEDAYQSFKVAADNLSISKAEYARAIEDVHASGRKTRAPEMRALSEEPSAENPPGYEQPETFPVFKEGMIEQVKALNKEARKRGFDTFDQMMQGEESSQAAMKMMADYRAHNPRYTFRQMAEMARTDFDNLSDRQKTVLLREAKRQFDAVEPETDIHGNLLAPNGEKSNLNSVQWKVTRTPFFRQWFGDWAANPESASKVVDEHGEPMIMYHGTKGSEIIDNIFKMQDAPGLGTGAYFTKYPDFAERHTGSTEIKKQGLVVPAFLNIKNPFITHGSAMGRNTLTEIGEFMFKKTPGTVDDFLQQYDKVTGNQKTSIEDGTLREAPAKASNDIDRAANMLIRQSRHDGIILNTPTQDFREVVVFRPEQIKSATGNQGTFTESPNILRGLSEEASPALHELNETVGNRFIAREFSPTSLVNEKTSLRASSPGSRFNLSEYSSPDLEHYSQPQEPEIIDAAVKIQQSGGVLQAADEILRNPKLEGLGLSAAGKSAFHDITLRGIDRMLASVNDGDVRVSPKEYNRLYDTAAQIEKSYADEKLEHGRYGAIAGRGVEKFLGGERAVKDYTGALFAAAKRKLREKQDSTILRDISDELNSVNAKVVDKTLTSAEGIALLRKLQSDMDKKGWASKVKKSFANSPAVKSAMRKSAMRAVSDHLSEADSNPMLRETAARIVRMMESDVPRRENAPSSESIFWQAVGETAREAGRETGIIPEREPKIRATNQEKLAALVRRPEDYGEFLTRLEASMVENAGDPSNPEFRSRVENFMERMRSKQWSEGLLEKVAGEAAKDLGVKFRDIARETYGKGQQDIELIKGRVRAALENYGVTDEISLTRIAEDIDGVMNRRVQEQREQVFGKATEVKRGLREIGTNLGEFARMGYLRRQAATQQLSGHLVNQLSLPPEYARALEKVIQRKAADLTIKERRAAMNRILNPRVPGHRDIKGAMEKIIDLSNLGVIGQEDVYNAVAEKLKLPQFDRDVADRIQEWGERIGELPPGTERSEEIIKLGRFIESRRGVSFKDMAVSGMYVSMLSGPTTHAVNFVSNATNLVATAYTEALQNPGNTGAILRAMYRGLTHSGKIEFGQTWRTGLSIGKLNQKFEFGNPLELENPVYLGKGAEVLGKTLEVGRAKYVHRALQAMDMLFYKAAQEMHFAARTGRVGTADEYRAALSEARTMLVDSGLDVDSRAGQRMVERRALELEESSRYRDFTPEERIAWNESHGEALSATFNEDPRGLIGSVARMLGKLTEEYPGLKPIIPFTRVVANVVNTQLDWTPVGIARFLHTKYGGGETWVLPKGHENAGAADTRHLIHGVTGTIGIAALGAVLGKYMDDPDPYLMITGNGPRDPGAKRQLLETGWKPNTLKVGKSYVSYLPTPFALAMSSLGTVLDSYRYTPKGKEAHINPALFGLALAQGTFNQSFLSGLSNLFAALDSPDPEARVTRVLTQMASLPVPNLVKQVDRWVDPSIQQSDTLWGNWVRQIPVVRHAERPMLNVFGQQVKRTAGPFNFPFLDRFITAQQLDDPVWQLVSEKRLTVPSYSPNTRIGDRPMTVSELDRYVSDAGPKAYNEIKNRIGELRSLSREDAQKEVDEIMQRYKSDARDRMRR